MSRIEPVAVKDLNPEMQAIMAAGNEIMGFTSSDSLIMAHKPALLKAMLSLVQAVYQPGAISLDLKGASKNSDFSVVVRRWRTQHRSV